ncbi:InlB B-repeat-containing protein, partial [Filifactor alocis]|uniref:InlB B-repeat-containing protein n=1 Tax=Filifactor alocis TaxID=143361 RepID=UPI0028EFE5FC
QPPQPQPQEYTVTVKSNNTTMGKVAPDKVEHVAKDTVIVENGNKLTINGKEVIATAEPGYKFNNWTGIPQGKKVVADVEITANFERENQPPQPTKYKIKLTDDGNGTAKSMVGGVQVTEAEQGKKVTITAMPDRGYKFDEWRVLSGGIRLRDEDSATTTFTMPNRDVEIKAYFKKKSSGGSSHDAEYYNITTKTDRHGTVEARSKAREGTEVSVTVDPDKGYKLDEITVTDKRGRDITIKETNRENRYKFTMPARDVTVEATFKQIKQEQPSKPTTPPTIPPTNNNKPTENNIIKKQQTTVFTIGSNIMTVITDGKATQTTIDAKPFLSQGRVMIPVRYAAESLGMQVEWNKQTQTVVLKDRENTVMIPIKTNKIIVGNQEYTSDVTPILKNGRTYLTISNIAKALQMRAGQDVKWDNKIKQVTIIKEVEVR